MKKRILMLLGLVLIFALYACSDDTSGNSNNNKDNVANESSNNNSSDDTSGNEGDKEQVELEIGLPGGFDLTSEEIFEGFQKEHPHIKVNAVEAPWGDYVKQIVTRIAGDTAPDLWFEENAKILGYGERGVAEDLTPYIEGDEDFDEDEYVDALLMTSTPDGTVYGIPHGINPIALVYNKTMFDEADMDYPSDDWTFQDMIEAAEKLTDKDNDIYGMDIATGITQGWYPWIRAGGGHILDETLTKTRVTEPETLEALNLWMDAIDRVSPSKEFKEASGGDAFGKEVAAMNFLQYSSQRHLNEEFPELEYDAVQIPKAFDGENRYVTTVVNSWVVYSKSDQDVKDAAWEFLKYYLSEEPQMILTNSFASLPVKKTALEALAEITDTKPSNKNAYIKGMEESGVTSDENPTWQEWRGEAASLFIDAIEGVLEPEEALEEMAEKVQAILDE